jgi:hypothetical protein
VAGFCEHGNEPSAFRIRRGSSSLAERLSVSRGLRVEEFSSSWSTCSRSCLFFFNVMRYDDVATSCFKTVVSGGVTQSCYYGNVRFVSRAKQGQDQKPELEMFLSKVPSTVTRNTVALSCQNLAAVSLHACVYSGLGFPADKDIVIWPQYLQATVLLTLFS